MAWIRLSDDYINDEKIDALSDGAFRLWHEAMAYCRRHQTDGSIPFTILRRFRSFTKRREKQLATPVREGLAPLWELVPAMGYRVHNYLNWNLSKEEETNERAGAAARMRKFRGRKEPPDQPAGYAVTNGVTNGATNGEVPDRIGKEEEVLQKELSDDFPERAGRLRQETYPRLYAKYRNGARLALFANSIEFQDALVLVQQWTDERLEKLATLVLTTDDPWISGTDRGFKVFVKKATWADERLAAWEAEKARTA